MKKTFWAAAWMTSVLAGLSALAYAYYFIVARDATMYSLFLLLTGLLSIKPLVALYSRLKEVEENFALIALILGIAGALGTAVHGGYDLANAINIPIGVNPSLPSQIDPRGLLAFGVMGIAILKISWLMSHHKDFAKGLPMLGYLSGILLVVIYLMRLTVLNPADPRLLYPVLLEGFIVNPLWYIWLGFEFRKRA